MKLLAFSDLHMSGNRARDIVTASAEADVVIGAGDFCNMRQGLDEAMAMFSDVDKPFLVVPGNAESDAELREAALPGMTVLHGECAVVGGVSFVGIGYAVPETPFGGWSCDLSEVTAEAMLAGYEDADVMILHSPPKGVADKTSEGVSVGSTALKAAIERIQPKLAVCGHIHDSWGKTGRIGRTNVVNLGPRPNWFEISI